MSKRRIVTDEEAAAEIEALRDSEFVKLARLEQRLKYNRRQALYTLRYLDKRGRELAEQGVTLESMDEHIASLEKIINEAE